MKIKVQSLKSVKIDSNRSDLVPGRKVLVDSKLLLKAGELQQGRSAHVSPSGALFLANQNSCNGSYFGTLLWMEGGEVKTDGYGQILPRNFSKFDLDAVIHGNKCYWTGYQYEKLASLC